MKASKLIERLKTFDENLILKLLNKDSFLIFDMVHESELHERFTLNWYTDSFNDMTIKHLLRELETENKHDYEIAKGYWVDSYSGSDYYDISINVTQQNEYLILELEII